ncbi:acyl carrier protein [Cohnella suwonensis]|uniref:Acyl carrier protein n=1 Tax=Cohnella suwonensis TaxID=696072 RepID=A0ABW0LTM5_9BACL
MSTDLARADVIQYLRKKIAEITESPELEQEANVHALIRDMGMDSLRIVQLIVHIEQYFEISFEDEELVIDFFSTIDHFASSIAKKRVCLA